MSRALIAVSAILLVLAVCGQAADLEVVSTAWMPDRAFDNYLPCFSEGWSLKDDLGNDKPYYDLVKQGATVRVCVRNTSAKPLDVARVELSGIDLVKQIVPEFDEKGGMNSASYLLNNATTTPPNVRDALDHLGRPVWYQVRPNPVPAGAFTEVTIRLRRIPSLKGIVISFGAATGSLTHVPFRFDRPTRFRLASISFSDPIDRVFIYARQDSGDFRLKSVKLDGVEAKLAPESPTASSGGVLPISIHLPKPWPFGSFHCMELTTQDGQTAASVIRARDAFFALGMWGYRNNYPTGAESARDTCAAFRDHLFNTHMLMVGGDQGSYMRSVPGMKLLEEMGLRVNTRDPSEENLRSPNVYSRFLMDEPDAHDYAVSALPLERRLGSLGQGVVKLQKAWTAADDRNLCLLNIDNTFKPENWLTYGALADITALDPYYPEVLITAYRKHPHKLGDSTHPYYVLAAADITRFASEPRPTHVILNSTSYRDKIGDFRFPTPEEKRIEFYYSLAAGAKGISYWWFAPYGECHGCGSNEPEARALMIELARLNVEARSLEPLLADSCAAAAPGAKYRSVRLSEAVLADGAHAALRDRHRHRASHQPGPRLRPRRNRLRADCQVQDHVQGAAVDARRARIRVRLRRRQARNGARGRHRSLRARHQRSQARANADLHRQTRPGIDHLQTLRRACAEGSVAKVAAAPARPEHPPAWFRQSHIAGLSSTTAWMHATHAVSS